MVEELTSDESSGEESDPELQEKKRQLIEQQAKLLEKKAFNSPSISENSQHKFVTYKPAKNEYCGNDIEILSPRGTKVLTLHRIKNKITSQDYKRMELQHLNATLE